MGRRTRERRRQGKRENGGNKKAKDVIKGETTDGARSTGENEIIGETQGKRKPSVKLEKVSK